MITRLTNNPIGGLTIKLAVVVLLAIKLIAVDNVGSNSMVYSFLKMELDLNSWLVKSCILASYLLATFLLLRINDKYRFVEFDTSPLWLFVVTGFSLFSLGVLHLNVAVSMLLNVILLNILLKIYHQPAVGGLIFSAAFLLALATILFYPSVLFLLLIISTLVIFRPFNLKNYLLIFVGFLLPLFYLIAFNYLAETNWVGIKPTIAIGNLTMQSLRPSSILFACFLILVPISLFQVITSQAKFIVRQRNQLVVIYFFIALMFFCGLVINFDNVLFFLLLPIGLCFNYWYQFVARKWILDTILIGLIITSFFIK